MLHRDAKLPDGSGPWLSDAWKVIAPDAAPVSSLRLSDITGRHLWSFLAQVAPPTLPDADRVALAEKWLGTRLPVERDRKGRIVSYRPALARIDDPHRLRRIARRRWRKDRSLRLMRKAPTATKWATSMDAAMHADSVTQYERHRQRTVLLGEDGTLLELPSRGDTARREYAMLLARAIGMAESAVASRRLVPKIITVTLPPAWHPTTTRKKRGRRPNPKWNRQSPKAAFAILQSAWRGVTRDLCGGRGRGDGIKTDWLRCVQPHKDGTPHLHIVMFAGVEDWPRIEGLLHGHFVENIEDATGTSTARRLRIDTIKEGSAGALAYVSRSLAYITRAVGTEDICEAEATAAWAGTWGIRRYQFSGRSRSTLYRLMLSRTFRNVDELAWAVSARIAGRWIDFNAACDAANLVPFYVAGVNQYGEKIRRLAGVRADDQVWTKQRWVRAPRPAESARKGGFGASSLVLCDNCAQASDDGGLERQAQPGSGSRWIESMPNGPPS